MTLFKGSIEQVYVKVKLIVVCYFVNFCYKGGDLYGVNCDGDGLEYS